MLIASWNVNGVRAAHRHGLLEWLEDRRPAVLCLQETKVSPAELPEELQKPGDYQGLWHSGQRQGYSGVATLWRRPPSWTLEGIGVPEIDAEGRVLTTEFEDFFLVNAYFPNSQADRSRLSFKLEFCEVMFRFLANLRKRGKGVVLTGDFNIAHTDLDLARPDVDRNHSGALPEERDWMDRLLQAGFVDVFRRDQPDTGHFSWWSYFAGEREANLGWRIDYFVVSEDLAGRCTSSIESQVTGSDHCPILLQLD